MPAPLRQLAFACALSCATTLAAAQSLQNPDSVVLAGLQVAKSVDSGRYAEVWNDASPVMKKLASKSVFVGMLAQSRSAVGGGGAAMNRVWTEVSRREFSGTAALPAGLYINVGYRTTFANGKTAHELVSFRLDEDNSWRVTGYVIN